MSESNTALKRRLVVGHKRDGRSRYDPQAKRELIEACLIPGVSVARMALEHGINANLLRTWIGKHQRQQQKHEATAKPAPFIPVIPISTHHALKTKSEWAAYLPNGVRLEWAALPTDELSQVLRLLCALPCSASKPG
jgi:transposase